MGNKLGTTGFFFGILAIVFSITIILGLIFGIIGLIFSIKGLNRANKEKDLNKGLEYAGIVLSSIGLTFSFFLMPLLLFASIFVFGINSGFDMINTEMTSKINEQGIPGEIKMIYNDVIYVSPDGKECSYGDIQRENCNILPKNISKFEIKGLDYRKKGDFKFTSDKKGSSYSVDLSL